MTKLTSVDWKACDAVVENLEDRLENLLSTEPYLTDDRRLSRVYLGLAHLLENRMNSQLREYLSLADKYSQTGTYPPELAGVPQILGTIASNLELQEVGGIESDQPFIYRLMKAITRERFCIHPVTDVEPIVWASAVGVPTERIVEIVMSVYPELSG